MHRSTRSAAFRPATTDGSCPGIPGYAGPWASPAIARAKAVSTAGFIAVSFASAIASGGAPASPLLKCSSTLEYRELANNASARRCCASFSSMDAGNHSDSYPQMNQPTCPASPVHHALLGPAPGRWSTTKIGTQERSRDDADRKRLNSLGGRMPTKLKRSLTLKNRSWVSGTRVAQRSDRASACPILMRFRSRRTHTGSLCDVD
jgi:hypothetical protein